MDELPVVRVECEGRTIALYESCRDAVVYAKGLPGRVRVIDTGPGGNEEVVWESPAPVVRKEPETPGEAAFVAFYGKSPQRFWDIQTPEGKANWERAAEAAIGMHSLRYGPLRPEPEKTLGQVAFEATGLPESVWGKLLGAQRDMWEKTAAAVEAELHRRNKKT